MREQLRNLGALLGSATKAGLRRRCESGKGKCAVRTFLVVLYTRYTQDEINTQVLGAPGTRGTLEINRELLNRELLVRLVSPAACACKRPFTACQNSFALDSYVDLVL